MKRPDEMQQGCCTLEHLILDLCYLLITSYFWDASLGTIVAILDLCHKTIVNVSFYPPGRCAYQLIVSCIFLLYFIVWRFRKKNFSKKIIFQVYTIGVSISLDPDQAQLFVGPDLG